MEESSTRFWREFEGALGLEQTQLQNSHDAALNARPGGDCYHASGEEKPPRELSCRTHGLGTRIAVRVGSSDLFRQRDRERAIEVVGFSERHEATDFRIHLVVPCQVSGSSEFATIFWSLTCSGGGQFNEAAIAVFRENGGDIAGGLSGS